MPTAAHALEWLAKSCEINLTNATWRSGVLVLQQLLEAYWDGRNNAGERVASGLYLY